MGIYLIFGKFGKTLSGALKPPVRQLRTGFSNSAQNLDSETIFKPFGLDGWLKVSYLLDYVVSCFIIHPYDPTVVICYLIWPCDIAVRITYLISHSSSLNYNTVIKGYFSLGV